MFKPLEIVGDTACRTTDQKVRGSNPFERADNFVGSLILFDELKDESELLNKLIETSRAAAGH